MSKHKIIIAGPVGAGKTTAVAAISDIPPVRTDARASDMTAQRKSNTTVAMDYGRLDLDGGEHVHIYGTPGQQRFDFMWEILSEGAIGLVLLINNNRPAPLQDLRFFVEAFSRQIADSRFVVGITHVDENESTTLDDYQQELENLGWCVPVFEVDARNGHDMRTLVKALLYTLDPGIVEPAHAA